MNPRRSTLSEPGDEEVLALIEVLPQTEARLQILTKGEFGKTEPAGVFEAKYLTRP